MNTGKIIAWDPKAQRGIVACSLSGQTHQFQYGHAMDRAAFGEGMRVTFDTAPSWTGLSGASNTIIALNVELASAAFLRYAAQYIPE